MFLFLLQINRTSPIGDLFFHSRPSAIARFIISVIIDAINGVARRRRTSHVHQKVLVNFPSFTDCYSPATIVLVVVLIRVKASFPHATPRTPFLRSCIAMAAKSIARQLSLITTATYDLASTQLNRIHIALIPAIASAMPEARFHLPQNRQTTESLSRQFESDTPWHTFNPLLFLPSIIAENHKHHSPFNQGVF